MRADPAMPSVYNLKPKFQNLLRPVTNGLAQAEVTANQVTIAAMLFSVATGDVVSDSALYLPLAVILPFNPALTVVIVLLAAISEMGKSDRALVFGALGLMLGLGVPMASAVVHMLWMTLALLVITILNRSRSALAELRSLTST
jgi:CDP-diacylglycerol---glycerol-3-phosphate 3-phosphatidyltransferase